MKKYTNSRFNLLGFSILIVLAFFTSCQKKEDTPKPDTYVNTWIEENMRYFYLWEDRISPNLDKNKKPDDFFESILYKQEDRFSWIQENYTDLLNELNGISKEAGYDFTLYRDSPDNSNVIAEVNYIKNGSPAASTSLKRGDIIYKINGQQITLSNYVSLLGAIQNPHTITFLPVDPENKTTLASQTISLTTTEYYEDPNYLTKIFTYGDRKIGYFVYNFFSPGPDTLYDHETDNIFANFKAEGITDLVLDLRYNGGGAVSSSINLASLIAPNITKTNVYIKGTYNSKVQADILADTSLGEEFLYDRFKEKAQNIGSLLRDKKIYVLTSRQTASSSELIINGLRPYMDVYLIGDTTYGKNVASISIYEENKPQNKWGMQPIIMKSENSVGFSDYGSGFNPNIVDVDNDQYKYQLGNEKETLLALAIQQITGVGAVARKSPNQLSSRAFVSSSILLKPHALKMTVDHNKHKKLFIKKL